MNILCRKSTPVPLKKHIRPHKKHERTYAFWKKLSKNLCKRKSEALLYLTFFTVMPKYGSRGKRILSRNRRSSCRRRTRVRREGENGGSKQKDWRNQRNSSEFLPYYPLTSNKNKWRGLFNKNPLFVYGYAEIRQPGQTDFEQKPSFFVPKAYEGTPRGRKRR